MIKTTKKTNRLALVICCITQSFTLSFIAGATSNQVDNVHGGFSTSVDLTPTLHNIYARHAQNWIFVDAVAEPGEYKTATYSTTEAETETCGSLGFSFTSFTVKLSGLMDPIGPGSGPCEREFSITGSYRGNYYILPSEAEIPGGTSESITFTAKIKDSNTNVVSDCYSNWKISPSPYEHGGVNFSASEQENSTTVSISNTATWKTPDSGYYAITATTYPDEIDETVVPLKVIEGKIYNNTAPGYDDYTFWSPQSGYPNSGKCTIPCFAVKKGVSSNIKLDVYPESTGSVDIEASGITASPNSTHRNTSITINSSSVGTSTVEASLNWKNHLNVNKKTKIAGCSIAMLNEKTVKVLFVKVNGASTDGSYSCFNQAITKVECDIDPTPFNIASVTFAGTVYPVNKDTIWTSYELDVLTNAYIAARSTAFLDGYDYIQFCLDVNISHDGSLNTIGLGEKPGKYSWVEKGLSQPYVRAHELGHNLGLEHRDNDTNALMYPYATLTANKLRMPEWLTVNSVNSQ